MFRSIRVRCSRPAAMLSVRCGRVRITLSFWFLATVTLFLLLDRSGYACFALLAVFVHEAGHLIALCCLGKAPAALCFSAEGICLFENKKPLAPLFEAVVLLSGSGANFLSALWLWYGVGSERAVHIAALHVLLGVFNLLPAASLDGGKLLSLCLSRFLLPDAVYRITAFFSAVTVLLLLTGGIYLTVRAHNLSLLWTCLILLVLRLTAKMTATDDMACNSNPDRL